MEDTLHYETVEHLPWDAEMYTSDSVRRHIYAEMNRTDEPMFKVVWVVWSEDRQIKEIYGSDGMNMADRVVKITYGE